jgi:hypothetical protein
VNLRWEGWVRTRNGAITCYVRIKAEDAVDAVHRAQASAHRKHGNKQYGLDDFVCIGVSLHEGDQNLIGDVP